MRTVDENGIEVASPDLEAGYLRVERIVVDHIPAVKAKPAKTKLVEVWADPNDPTRKLYDRVTVKPAEPARPARDVYETVNVYHPYTAEELAEREAAAEAARAEAEAAAAAAEEAAAALAAEQAAAAEKAEFDAALPDALTELAAMADESASAIESTQASIEDIYDALAELGMMIGGNEEVSNG